MHQLVGQLTGTRQKQQAFGVQVEPSHGLPFALKQFGQPPKNSGPVLRIVMRHHLSGGLVVGNNARRRRVNAHPDGLAIDLDGIAELNALPDVGGLGIHRNTPFQYQLLHFQPRTQAGLCQHFVQLGRFGLR